MAASVWPSTSIAVERATSPVVSMHSVAVRLASPTERLTSRGVPGAAVAGVVPGAVLAVVPSGVPGDVTGDVPVWAVIGIVVAAPDGLSSPPPNAWPSKGDPMADCWWAPV